MYAYVRVKIPVEKGRITRKTIRGTESLSTCSIAKGARRPVDVGPARTEAERRPGRAVQCVAFMFGGVIETGT